MLDEPWLSTFAALETDSWDERRNSTKYLAIDPRTGLGYPPKLVCEMALGLTNTYGGEPTNSVLRAAGIKVILKVDYHLHRHIFVERDQVLQMGLRSQLDPTSLVIWVKGFYGFGPSGLGALGFTYPGDRRTFLNST